MNLKVGIVGMPNVGKSTLFNALLKKQVAFAANYPFATIEPNVGIIEVPDERLTKLAEIISQNPSTHSTDAQSRLEQSRKTTAPRTSAKPPIVPAIVEFYDIAGLVKGASKGEGLGNQFLSHIREVSAIIHVVRLFEDSDIIHVANKVDPKTDIEIIDEELALADLATLSKQREPRPASAQGSVETRVIKMQWEVVTEVRNELNQGIPVRNQGLSDEEKEAIKHLNLLTAKPVIFCFNCSLEQLEKEQDTRDKIQTILKDSNNQNAGFLIFNPLIEETLDEMIKKAYEILNLISFLTAGEREVRAWTIEKGINAQKAAGVIHTDFEKNFIKAEVVSFGDFVSSAGWVGAREKGKAQIAGRDYTMRDGDIVDFKVGV